MATRRQAVITVRVDLDPVPGTFHVADDHVRYLQAHLSRVIPHYNPEVTLDHVTVKCLGLNTQCTHQVCIDFHNRENNS